MCEPVLKMDSQMAECILTKTYKHDPWVPAKHQKFSESVTPCGEIRNSKFPYKKAFFKTMAQ